MKPLERSSVFGDSVVVVATPLRKKLVNFRIVKDRLIKVALVEYFLEDARLKLFEPRLQAPKNS